MGPSIGLGNPVQGTGYTTGYHPRMNDASVRIASGDGTRAARPQATVGRYLRYLTACMVGCVALLAPLARAHPTGTMITAGDFLLWSYVCPVDSTEHRACVMVWDDQEGARIWLTSEHAASDWMIAPTGGEEVLLVERYFDASIDGHRFRVLEAVPLEEPRVLSGWMEDDHRFGEAGFTRLPNEEFLFARYPHLYTMRLGGDPVAWGRWPSGDARAVAEVEFVPPDRLLVRSEEQAWLVSLDGEPIEHWTALLEEPTMPLPLMGNRVFDAAYDGSSLVLAYWGQRRFDVIQGGERSSIHVVEPPFLPHAVAASDGRVFLLASSLDPSSPIRPRLWLWEGEDVALIWDGR